MQSQPQPHLAVFSDLFAQNEFRDKLNGRKVYTLEERDSTSCLRHKDCEFSCELRFLCCEWKPYDVINAHEISALIHTRDVLPIGAFH